MLIFRDLPVSVWSCLTLSLVLLYLTVRSRLNFLGIPEIPVKKAGEALPDCMVVIPARNEASNIGRAVKSLPHDTVIVVDDGSEDDTAPLARAAGAGVIRAPKLPKAVIGKSFACAEGAKVITSKWILFTDADTWFERDFLESAIAAAESA